MGSTPSPLSMVSSTSARPSAGRPGEPAKMTSSIFPPRSALAPCSPRTQAMASTTLLLPEPLGPTTQVMPGSSCRVVVPAKDLNPRKVRLFRCIEADANPTGTGKRRTPRRKGEAFRGGASDKGSSGESRLAFQSAQLVAHIDLRRQRLVHGLCVRERRFQVAHAGAQSAHLGCESQIGAYTDMPEQGLRHQGVLRIE